MAVMLHGRPILTLLCHFSHGFGAHFIDHSSSGPPDRECAARVRGPADFGAQFPLHLALFQGEDVKTSGRVCGEPVRLCYPHLPLEVCEVYVKRLEVFV